MVTHFTTDDYHAALELLDALLALAADELNNDLHGVPEHLEEARATVEAVVAGAADMGVVRKDLQELTELREGGS